MIKELLKKKSIKYFDDFSKKSLKNLSETFSRNISLEDWENKFIKKLKKNNINPGIHYLLPNHKHIPYKKYKNNNLRVTNIISPQILSIPIYPLLKINIQKKIVNILNSIQ